MTDVAIHPAAVVSRHAEIAPGARVGPFAMIGDGYTVFICSETSDCSTFTCFACEAFFLLEYSSMPLVPL